MWHRRVRSNHVEDRGSVDGVPGRCLPVRASGDRALPARPPGHVRAATRVPPGAGRRAVHVRPQRIGSWAQRPQHRGRVDRKWGMRLGGTRLLQLYFGKYTVPHLEAQYRAVYDALDGADVLFGHPAACIVGAMAAEQRGLPWIGGDLFPMLVPTETQNPLPPVSTLGPGLNRLSWRIARSPRPNSLTFSRDFADFRRGKGWTTRCGARWICASLPTSTWAWPRTTMWRRPPTGHRTTR